MCYDAYTTITEVFQMALRHASDAESFIAAVKSLNSGDTVEVDGFDSAAGSTAELLEMDLIRLPAVQQNCWMGFAVLQTAVRIS